MVQVVFITLELYHFVKVDGLKSHYLMLALMRDIFLLHNISHNINERQISLIQFNEMKT